MVDPSLEVQWRDRLATMVQSMDGKTADLGVVYVDLERLLADMRLTPLPIDHELFARVHEQLARCLRHSPDTTPAKALAAGMSHILRPLYDEVRPKDTDTLEAQETGQAGVGVHGIHGGDPVSTGQQWTENVAQATTGMALSWWWERQKRRWWAPLGLLAMGTMALLVM